ncbi:MAG: ABC transporter ATP-binding protein/permease [candidate division WOR-3 bacterium]|nr:ABC transporter ATP-binding protein/permease [candidate division WOR-3 bacterium]MCX7836810.1 ABC transporter ATP-binding protein/permease [candidate division WOR-3 bacterium]MDW8113873.1 ABC transporter ATP-binding protein [candidate division WOR-3 bacterium]
MFNKILKPVLPKKVMEFWKRNLLLFILLLIITLLATSFSLSFPILLRYIIDGIQKKLESKLILKYLILLFIFGFFRSFLTSILPFLRGKINEKFGYQMRNWLYQSILKKGQSFLNKFPSGDVIERLSEDLQDYQWFSCSGIFRPFEGIFTILIALIILLKMNVLLTVIVLIPIFLAFFVWYKLGPIFTKAYFNWREKISLTYNFFQSVFFGIRIVKSYLMAERLIKRLSELLKERVISAVKVAKLEAQLGIFYTAIAESSVLIIFLLGGYLVINNKLTIGQFVAFNTYVLMLLTPMFDISNFFIAGRRAVACEERILNLESFPPDIEDKKEEKEISDFSEIIFENISFSYNGEEVLENLNLIIKKGEKIGIAGTVGSGKTTFIKLLLKLLKPKNGKIFLKKYNQLFEYEELKSESIRKLFSYVPQDSFIFSDTIYNNIALGKELKEEDLNYFIKLVNFEQELKEMKNGIKELVGERGTGLSGGQKQKLSLLRALIEKRPILILDDATSNLDSETELKIINQLINEYKDLTIIIVSHRLSTLANCEKIYVFDKGKIVEEGKHENLLLKEGIYYQLYKKQLLKEEIAKI